MRAARQRAGYSELTTAPSAVSAGGARGAPAGCRDAAAGASAKRLNALTIDVEDYFHVQAFAQTIRRDDWDGFTLRVADNTRRILDVLDEAGLHATFFVLGWVAERCRPLVREIAERGHEVASHGYGHEQLFQIGPDRFREDLRRSKAVIEGSCGAAVTGYRAPSFSITKRSLWAFEILVEEGFRFDSSVFPIHHDLYGMPEAPGEPHLVSTPSGSLAEFPMSTVSFSLLGRSLRFPVSGGGYLRILPLRFVSWAFERINTRDGRPVVLYFHPWEIDPGQPRIKAGRLSRWRHYRNLDSTAGKLGRLFSSFRFAPMGQVLASLGLGTGA